MSAIALLETPIVSEPAVDEPLEQTFYEVVDGHWIETPTMSYYASIVTSRLNGYVTLHLEQQNPAPGQAVVETLFRIPTRKDASRKRRPDLAYVSAGRWATDRPVSLLEDAWDVVPDLAVEVVSPTDRVTDLTDKVQEYFQAGVRLVWVVHPIQRVIHVHEAWDRIRVVTESGSLDGGEVLPGFRRAIDRLFGPVAAENGASNDRPGGPV